MFRDRYYSKKRSKIITLNEHTSMTVRDIAAVVGVGNSSASKILKKFQDSGTFSPKRKGKCRLQRKTTPRTDKILIRNSKISPRFAKIFEGFIGFWCCSRAPLLFGKRLLEVRRKATRPRKKQFPVQKRWDPPSLDTDVRAFLDTTFPNQWIVLGGLITRPLRSLDLTLPYLLFLLGLLKSQFKEDDVEDIRCCCVDGNATWNTDGTRLPTEDLQDCQRRNVHPRIAGGQGSKGAQSLTDASAYPL
ncbi:HTH_Tnp_Tc3_2 domain-containing protein [Trichonephila clavipes]|nr:HTH_Tnp_Tc3_2 domain-containing protein [Trichonephila clavipes]